MQLYGRNRISEDGVTTALPAKQFSPLAATTPSSGGQLNKH
jgi:hypothetical protein